MAKKEDFNNGSTRLPHNLSQGSGEEGWKGFISGSVISFFVGLFGLTGIGIFWGLWIASKTGIFQAIGIPLKTPWLILGYFGCTFLAALFGYIGAIAGLQRRNCRPILWPIERFLFLWGFLFSLSALLIQFYLLYQWGFLWLGKAFFGNQPFTELDTFLWLGVFIFVISLVNPLENGVFLFGKPVRYGQGTVSVEASTKSADSVLKENHES